MSTTRCVPALAYRHTLPLTPTLETTRFGTMAPTVRLRWTPEGRGVPQGLAWTYLLVAETPVTLGTTAAALERALGGSAPRGLHLDRGTGAGLGPGVVLPGAVGSGVEQAFRRAGTNEARQALGETARLR